MRYWVVFLAMSVAFAQPASAALVGYWNFDDGTANDFSGTGNDGTFQNGAATSTDVNPGNGARSLSVTGAQHVLVPDDASLDIGTAITVSAWVKKTTTGFDALLHKGPSDGSSPPNSGNYEWRLNAGDSNPHFGWEDQPGPDLQDSRTDSTTIVPSNVWTHLAFAGTQGGGFQFYLNGLPTAGTGVLPASFLEETNSNPLFIGNRAGLSIPLDGFIDEVGIWDVALTDLQVADVFANGVGGGATAAAVPEPSSLLLGGLAMSSLALRRRRRESDENAAD